MRVSVEITGILRRPSGRAVVDLELPEGATAAQAIGQLGYSEAEQRALRLSRDAVVLGPAESLRDGERVHLFAAIGGG